MPPVLERERGRQRVELLRRRPPSFLRAISARVHLLDADGLDYLSAAAALVATYVDRRLAHGVKAENDLAVCGQRMSALVNGHAAIRDARRPGVGVNVERRGVDGSASAVV